MLTARTVLLKPNWWHQRPGRQCANAVHDWNACCAMTHIYHQDVWVSSGLVAHNTWTVGMDWTWVGSNSTHRLVQSHQFAHSKSKHTVKYTHQELGGSPAMLT